MVEELLTNSLKFGHLPEKSSIILEVGQSAGGVFLQYSDFGVKFNPTTYVCAHRVSLNTEELRVGGVGLLMIDHYCSKFKYHRENHRNIIQLFFNMWCTQ